MVGLVFDILSHFFWVIMAVAFLFMRQASIIWHRRWRDQTKLVNEVQVENERLLADRDELVQIGRGLGEIIDQAEGKWSALEADQDKERQRHLAMLAEHMERQRRERAEKIEANRDRLMREMQAHEAREREKQDKLYHHLTGGF